MKEQSEVDRRSFLKKALFSASAMVVLCSPLKLSGLNKRNWDYFTIEEGVCIDCEHCLEKADPPPVYFKPGKAGDVRFNSYYGPTGYDDQMITPEQQYMAIFEEMMDECPVHAFHQPGN